MCESFDLGFGKVLENGCYHMCQARICIRICITRVPAYVKWMWQNEKLLDTTKISFSRRCLFEPVVIYIYIYSICLILFVCITSMWRDVPQPREQVEFLKFSESTSCRFNTIESWWLRNHRSTSLDFEWQMATFIFQVDTVKWIL